MKNRIRELRQEAGMSTKDLATKLSVTERTIQRYESSGMDNKESRQVPHDKLDILVELFDCSLDYILYKTNQRKNIIKFDNSVSEESKRIFAERLRNRIVDLEVTKGNLAEILGLDKEVLDKYLNLELYPNIEILKKMSISLLTTVDYLIGESNEPSRKTLKKAVDVIVDKNKIKPGRFDGIYIDIDEGKTLKCEDIEYLLESLPEDVKKQLKKTMD
jgi:transcriptional regulator with XRE-family HTH domain